MKGQELQYIGLDNLLLRETTLRNTDEVVGVAVYCGYDTKILQNQGYYNCYADRSTIK